MKHRKLLLQLQKNVTDTLNLTLKLFFFNPIYNFIFILWDMGKRSHKIKQNLDFTAQDIFDIHSFISRT